MPHGIVLSQLLQQNFIQMKSLKAMEDACDMQMKQRCHIIEGNSHLSYRKMETTSFLMPPLRKSLYKSLIASVQGTCDQRT